MSFQQLLPQHLASVAVATRGEHLLQGSTDIWSNRASPWIRFYLCVSVALFAIYLYPTPLLFVQIDCMVVSYGSEGTWIGLCIRRDGQKMKQGKEVCDDVYDLRHICLLFRVSYFRLIIQGPVGPCQCMFLDTLDLRVASSLRFGEVYNSKLCRNLRAVGGLKWQECNLSLQIALHPLRLFLSTTVLRRDNGPRNKPRTGR